MSTDGRNSGGSGTGGEAGTGAGAADITGAGPGAAAGAGTGAGEVAGAGRRAAAGAGADDHGRAEQPAPAHEFTEGGDPVCWLDRVCDECGAMREDPRAAVCARCGAPVPGPDGPGGSLGPSVRGGHDLGEGHATDGAAADAPGGLPKGPPAGVC